MKEIPIKCNTNGQITIDNDFYGIQIALVNDNGIPVARYEFDSEELSSPTTLQYEASESQIHFYGEIKPTMKCENVSNDD